MNVIEIELNVVLCMPYNIVCRFYLFVRVNKAITQANRVGNDMPTSPGKLQGYS